MKLTKRIRDLMRAGLASRPRLTRLGKAKSPARMEAELRRIRKSLVHAAGRENRLRDDLVIAEEEGREREVVRLQRELAELAQSRDELQAALDLIEARIEMEAKVQEDKAEPRPLTETPFAEERAGLPQVSEADAEGDTDLAARKARLAAPRKKGQDKT